LLWFDPERAILSTRRLRTLQDMANQLKCSSSATDAIAVGFEVALSPDAPSRNSASLVAAEIQSTFGAALPGLSLHGMCHGTVRVPPHGATPARPTRPAVLPPDSACMHSASALASTCLPLWHVQLFRGPCKRTLLVNGTTSVASGPPDGAADVHFATRAVDLFKSTCREAFPGFPAGWKHGYCARFSATVCATRAPQVFRLELAAGGPTRAPASLLFDGETVAYIDNGTPTGKHKVNVAGAAAEQLQDAIVVLGQGCHHIEAFYEEASEGEKLAMGNVTLVRSSETRCNVSQLASLRRGARLALA
jgi:hypothetical protein